MIASVVAVAAGGGDERAADQSEALEAEQLLGDLVRQLGPDQPAAHAERGEVRLVAEPLEQLRGAAGQRARVEQRLQVELYDRAALRRSWSLPVRPHWRGEHARARRDSKRRAAGPRPPVEFRTTG